MNADCVDKSYFAGVYVAAVCVDVRVIREEYRRIDICGGGNRSARVTRLYGYDSATVLAHQSQAKILCKTAVS